MPFQKGNKLSAKSRKIPEKVLQQLRDATPDAVKMLVDLMNNGKSEKIRLAATIEVLNRNLGKPTERHEVSGNDGQPLQLNVKVEELQQTYTI